MSAALPGYLAFSSMYKQYNNSKYCKIYNYYKLTLGWKYTYL